MSSQIAATLADRRNDLTRQVILDAAVDVLESPDSVDGLTYLAVAKRARISQRTVFRYFPTRDQFLDAVADAARGRLALPPPPRTVDELRTAPRALYAAFEANARLVTAGMHSELAPRMREGARPRWDAIRAIVDALGRRRGERARTIAWANISHLLAATAWHYYRERLGLTAEEAIASAEAAVGNALEGLRGTSGA